MKVLELFAGSRSIGKVAQAFGMEVFSSDIHPFEGIDYITDILSFDVKRVPWKPDIIWASPPCTGFSVSSIGFHWGGGKRAYVPKSDTARLGIAIVKKVLEIINYFQPKYFFIENPRGVLRKMPFMQGLHRNTLTYCQYGDSRMKPTDIWTNCKEWEPRRMCQKGASCHEPAPRGSHNGGTQLLKNAYERSKIPPALCEEVLEICARGKFPIVHINYYCYINFFG